MSVVREFKDGEISAIYAEDFGQVTALDGEVNEFFQRGAQVQFKIGDGVSYIRISLPNGKIIVKDVGKK